MKLKKTILLGAGLLSISLLISAPAMADDEAMLKLLRILEHNGTIDAAAAQSLKNAVTTQTKEQDEKTQAAIKEATKDNLKVTTNGKLAIESPDGDFKFTFNGRIMADATFVGSDLSNQDSGTELRRARIGIGGTMYKVWGFQLTPDFANSSVSMKDAYITYKGFNNAKITVGNHHAPFAMELADSSKYMTFIERSIGSELLQGASGPGDRRMGLSAAHYGDNWTLQYGAFGQGVSTADDSRVTYTTRATFSPIHEKTHALHFGAGYAYQSFDQDEGTVTLRTRPGDHVSDRWLDATLITDDAEFLTLDLAYVKGPFSIQTEYDRGMFDTANGDVNVDSYFVQADWFLTGESRNYNAKKGHFSSVTPKGTVGQGGSGAWQLAARFASADMTDGNFIGGELDVMTLGLNWYAAKNIRFMANYNKVLDVKNGAVADNDKLSSFVLRSQVYW